MGRSRPAPIRCWRLCARSCAYPAPACRTPPDASAAIVVPFEIESPVGRLSFLSTTTVFGTPVEVTLSEVAIEAFFPADEATAKALQALG